MPAVHAAGTVPYLLWFPQSSAPADGFTLVRPREMESEQRTQSRDPIAAPSHIIERPRLIKLMEESGARVIVLNAPAGYGKTTLARQWVAREGRQAAWYRCSASSSDLAVVAQGLVTAIQTVIPTAGDRALERLRAARTPEQDASIIAELMVSDLAAWPPAAWLVVDDYHLLEQSTAVARFAEEVLDADRPRVLVTSRTRPSWATARRLLYGEILEIDRLALTMSAEEAAAVLADRPKPNLSSLLEYARGWPAVIGLAALAPHAPVPEAELPTPLYDFFAEELYQASPDAERLGELALVPVLTETSVQRVFGADARRIIDEACQLGIMESSVEGQLELHPLLRTFLRKKLTSSPEGRNAASRVATLLVDSGDCEGAFGIVEDFNIPELVPTLVASGLEDALSEGRLASITRWLRYGEDHFIQHPILDLAAAEISFREGLYRQSEALATRAAEDLVGEPQFRTSALIRGAHSALQGNRLETSYDLATKAVSSASTPFERREARIIQLFAALELERDETLDLAQTLDDRQDRSPDGELRTTNARLVVASRVGDLETALAQGEAAMHLLSSSLSPMARGSFLSSFAHVLALTARYRRAIDVAAQEINVASAYRLDFARYHGLAAQAIARLGLGEATRAAAAISEIRAYGNDLEDSYFRFYAVALEARSLVTQGAAEAAVDITRAMPDPDVSPSLRGEYLGYRALSLACVGDHTAAERAAQDAESASRWGIEARVLAAAARTVTRIESGAPVAGVVSDLMALIEGSGNVDSFVSLCLAHSPFVEKALESPSRPEITAIFARTANPHLVRLVPEAERVAVARSLRQLSPREREVHRFLVAGLSNRQIAEALFLSEKTVKVHVRHIYDKLGVRSRLQVALRTRDDD